jgi:hypothetical protein
MVRLGWEDLRTGGGWDCGLPIQVFLLPQQSGHGLDEGRVRGFGFGPVRFGEVGCGGEAGFVDASPFEGSEGFFGFLEDEDALVGHCRCCIGMCVCMCVLEWLE